MPGTAGSRRVGAPRFMAALVPPGVPCFATGRRALAWRLDELISSVDAGCSQGRVPFYSFLGQPPWLSSCFVRPELLKQVPVARSAEHSPAAERLRIIRSFDTGVFRKGSLAMNGVDERDPTADRRLIEFSLQLPPEQLLQHRVFKPLARAALEDRVPQFVLDAPVRGYQGADWFSRLAQADALAVLEEVSSSHGVQELLDLPRLRQRAAMWPYPGQGPAMKIDFRPAADQRAVDGGIRPGNRATARGARRLNPGGHPRGGSSARIAIEWVTI